MNIDPRKIESAIDEDTEAILATHCFGNPCDIDAIQAIADKYSLRVIYDAAHCFGTKYKGRSVFSYGDISTTSFHATKLYHTIEGGAIFSNDADLLKRMAFLRNFGHDGPEKFNGIGINGKNSEFHAAMGLVNLSYVDNILTSRKTVSHWYDKFLIHEDIIRPITILQSEGNNSYYPILLTDEKQLIDVKNALEQEEIFPRRYFYPSLNNLDYTNGNAPVSVDVSSRILCLPLYYKLSSEEVLKISRIILRVLNN